MRSGELPNFTIRSAETVAGSHIMATISKAGQP
jgi:hypothetical protein